MSRKEGCQGKKRAKEGRTSIIEGYQDKEGRKGIKEGRKEGHQERKEGHQGRKGGHQ